MQKILFYPTVKIVKETDNFNWNKFFHCRRSESEIFENLSLHGKYEWKRKKKVLQEISEAFTQRLEIQYHTKWIFFSLFFFFLWRQVVAVEIIFMGIRVNGGWLPMHGSLFVVLFFFLSDNFNNYK